jgi:hypothetical protein
LSFGAIERCFISLEPARWDDSNGIALSVIAPKPMELPPNMGMGGERLGKARVFEFWCYCIVLNTIGTGSMRHFQWYWAICNSIKTQRATPKYFLVQVIPVE